MHRSLSVSNEILGSVACLFDDANIALFPVSCSALLPQGLQTSVVSCWQCDWLRRKVAGRCFSGGQLGWPYAWVLREYC